MILAGHSVSAQLTPFPPLSKVNVPRPDNIERFIKDKTSAIALGKALFWDMQVGSDGIQSCASCHFNAGADSRSKNQVNPGLNKKFDVASAPNYQLQPEDYPFHKLENPDDISSRVTRVDDVTGSQGAFPSRFIDVKEGSDKDITTPVDDSDFNVKGVNVRRVTNRNSPSVINAVFNFRNFYDGRAQNIFNGVNALGLRDKNAYVLEASNQRRLKDTKVKINNSSLASQAIGPVLDAFELGAEIVDIETPVEVNMDKSEETIEVDDENGNMIDKGSSDEGVSVERSAEQSGQNSDKPKEAESIEEGKQRIQRRKEEIQGLKAKRPFDTIGRKLGKKLLAVTPLSKQVVASDDSVLGSLSKSPKGLNTSYEQLIKDAFQPDWWDSKLIITINKDGSRIFRRKPRKRPLRTNEYTLMEYNFALFFGLAVQEYESTLISDQTPFDRFLGGDKSALNAQQKRGFELFQESGCINCHSGSELTAASVNNVEKQGRIQRTPVGSNPVQDTGFFPIGVRPNEEDVGLADTDGIVVPGEDESGNSLSEATLAFKGKFKELLGEEPPVVPKSEEDIVAEGAFKSPGLRNIELTAPYMHNGEQLTLEQVIDFYNRGGNFGGLRVLDLTEEDKEALVAFLKGLTDERVRNQKAPFDHPQLLVPNGHPDDENSVVVDSEKSNTIKQAKDNLLEIPAVGRNGGDPLPKFLDS